MGLLPCLRDFLLDYVQIALHIVQLETTLLRALSKDPDQPTPDSMSHRYLQCVTWIVAFNDSTPPLYTILDREYGIGFRDFLIDIRAHTLRPLNVADKLAEHCEVVLELIPKHSRLLNMLIFYLTITCSLVDYMPDILDTKDLLSPKDASADLLYNMTRSIDIHYQEWIAKKAPWVTSESSEALQEQISSSMIAFCHRSDDFLHRLSNDLSIEIPHSATAAQKATILTGVWRFGVLKKHFMEGRMELRVHGVDKMQGELIVVWRNFINPDPNGISNPFVQSLIHFIKDNKIVDYLVGVDSHPQLISRSSNIVGFLVATASYTDRETDIIWKAVTESQDGRVVSEILSAVTRTIVMHPSASPALLYFCEKVLNHPLERFDSSMIEFSSRLLEQTIPRGNSPHSPSHSDAQHALAIPLRLCVRLIRESTVVEDLSAEQRTQLQNLGSSKLADFIRAGIGEDDRMEIYERCIQDIAEMNQFTTGSIQALSALVPQWDVAEMMKLAAEFDLTRLVINEMLHTVNETSFDLADCFSQHSLVSRIDILSRLISQAPETVTPDLGSALWNQILLSPKMGPKGHKSVWDMMVKTIERSASQNSFLDRCIHEYMPQLTPKNYDEELLLFVKLSVYYEVRFKPPPAAGENQTIFIPVMDRIWDIILTAPPGTVETEATKFAIEVYLDHKIIQMAPRSAVEATHVAIVGRCVDQLKSAAATIKARGQSDNTLVANGGTEMETTESNDDGELNELMFKRSLLFLHRLLDGLQTRPQYSPPRGSPPVLPQKRLKGDPIDLKWQSFHGGSHSAIQSLRIGDHSTAAELVESLTQLTGFSKFTVIGGGARLDLYEKPETLIKDIRALQAGLLMVRRAADAQDLGSNRQPRSLTSVAVEVMKHFDEIYPFLALSEELANEVRII